MNHSQEPLSPADVPADILRPTAAMDIIDLAPEDDLLRARPAAAPPKRPVRASEIAHSVRRTFNDHAMMRSCMQAVMAGTASARLIWAEDHGMECNSVTPVAAKDMLEHCLKLTDWLE
jgi:hypothetical protein